MPRPVGYGRPGTAVFPEGWADTGAGVVAASLESTVQVGPAGDGPAGWNSERRQMETPPGNPVYDGPAGIAAASADATARVAAEDDVTVRVLEITLDPSHAGVDQVTADHVVHITSCSDPLLDGRTLDVATVETGDRRFSRVLLATLND